jgi:formylglycine-generating enzyme required for sulfatase activity
MWEEVCDSCGTKQNDLAENRKTEMAAQQEQAGELLKIYDFAAAGKIATALQDEPDLRFRHLKGWAEQFLGDVEQEREQQQQRMLELVKESLQHEEAYDYRSGIHTLEQVSDILRQEPLPDHPSGVAEVLSRLVEKQTESQRLDQLIRERIKSRQLAGLLDEVDSLLQLRPDHVEMGTLRDKLVDRNEKLQATRDSALPTAQQLFSNKDYEGCLAELGKIDDSVMTSEAEELRGHCTATLDQIEQLKSSIGEAVKQKKLHGLLKQVEEYLGLKPDAEQMKKLQQQLIEQDKKNAVQIAEMVQTAQRMRSECRFSDAVDTLRRIPQPMQTPEMISLLNDCDSLAIMRVTAMDALQSAIQGEQYQSGLTGSDLYRETLKSQSLNDQAFADQYQSCAVTLQQQQDVAQAANQRRAKIKKMIIAGSALAAVLLILMTGLWIRSGIKERAAIAQVAAAEKVVADKAAADKAAADKADDDEVAAKSAMAPPSAIAPFDAEEAKSHQKAWADYLGQPIEMTNSIGMKLNLIPAGEFQMGSPDSEAGRSDDETQHLVKITKPFYLGATEVTQAQYKRMMHLDVLDMPMHHVSWNMAKAFCQRLSALPEEKAAGHVYRLPTEAEWEYACRAGTTTAYSFGDDAAQLGEYKGSRDGTHLVGTRKPNSWGLYDMHGSVYEWCQDWSAPYDSKRTVSDPTGPAQGIRRVLRGGKFTSFAKNVRSASRYKYNADSTSDFFGFRVTRELK